MTRVVLLFVLSAVLLAQSQGPDPTVPRRDDKYRDDPHAACFHSENDEPYPGNPSMHPCHCVLMCAGVDADGNHHQTESAACELYCTHERCSCHPEEDACEL